MPEYWTHVEYHPTHLAVRLDSEDQVFVMLSDECIGENDPSPSAHLLMLFNTGRPRYINSYGLENPRLDRLHGIAEFKNNQPVDDMNPAVDMKTTLRHSLEAFDRLNGRKIYQRHWQAFFDDMREGLERMVGVVSPSQFFNRAAGLETTKTPRAVWYGCAMGSHDMTCEEGTLASQIGRYVGIRFAGDIYVCEFWNERELAAPH